MDLSQVKAVANKIDYYGRVDNILKSLEFKEAYFKLAMILSTESTVNIKIYMCYANVYRYKIKCLLALTVNVDSYISVNYKSLDIPWFEK